MKNNIFIFIIAVALILSSCDNTANQVVQFDDLTVSGEFLFEGPNTLQGSFSISNDDIAKKLSISPENISSVTIESIQTQLPNDSAHVNIESLLVQVVSDDAPLVTLGTISPLAAETIQTLSINSEVNINPYLKTENSTLIVDTNLRSDADALTLTVNIGLLVTFKQ
jgi:hypothetical protein